MEPERWQQVDRVFEAALELSAEQRGSFLDRECAGDEELRQEVEALLAHDRGDSFLESGGSAEAALLLGEGVRESLLGRRVGRFEIEARLGAGGMGEVYRARDPLLGRPVALKLIPAHLRDDPERRRRFRKEALATSALNHPNIVTVYEILELAEHDVLVTELVDGVTLHECMRAGLQPAAALEIATQVARALAAAHAVGVVHRDVKPQNVMVRRDGLVKLLDFGIAKSFANQASQGETSPGEVLGTVAYMSPEQARGQPVDARTDAWSLGVILYQMVTGEAPFRGSSPTDTLVAILTHEPEPPSRRQKGLPAELDRIVARALAKDRELRYPDGAAFTAHLERVLETLNEPSSMGRAQEPLPAASSARQPAPARAKVAVVGIAVVGLVVAASLYLGPPAHDAIDSLAVLPLVNMGADPQSEYLSEGIAESLIQNLGQAGDLKVMSRAASFRYRGRESEASTIGRELGVRGILTGRMAPRADGVELSLELIDARDDSHVWGAQYTARTAELVSLHERIARDLRGRLDRRLDPSHEARLARLHTDDAEAYQLYLQGRYYWHRPLPEDFHRSRDYFQRAIESDPDYALAWSGLVNYYGRGASTGLLDPDVYWPRAAQAAQRTLELDPELPEARPHLAAIALYWHRDWTEGERLMRQAVEVFPEAVSHFAFYLSLTGRFDDSLRILRTDFDDDPHPVRSNRSLATGYYYARRHQEAVDQARATLDVDSTDVPSWELLGDAQLELGRHGEAVAAWREGLVLEGLPQLAAELERTFDAFGIEAALRGVALGRIEWLRARQERGDYVPAYYFARLHLRAGELASALDSAEQAFAERNRLVLDMLNDPVFDPLRQEPRFVEGVSGLGLPGAETFASASATRHDPSR